MREMREKRKAYVGQDVYIGRPGRLPDVECCHLVVCMVSHLAADTNNPSHVVYHEAIEGNFVFSI